MSSPHQLAFGAIDEPIVIDELPTPAGWGITPDICARRRMCYDHLQELPPCPISPRYRLPPISLTRLIVGGIATGEPA
jgi:hypothetical protein